MSAVPRATARDGHTRSGSEQVVILPLKQTLRLRNSRFRTLYYVRRAQSGRIQEKAQSQENFVQRYSVYGSARTIISTHLRPEPDTCANSGGQALRALPAGKTKTRRK